MNIRSRIAAAFTAIAFATGAFAQGALVDVVEFYNDTLDHHFISSLPADIAALDSGALKGWARTGQEFKAYDAPAAGTSPVCRFYIPPASGDSHFYSASPAECAEVAAKFPTFSYESPGVMHVGLPDPGTGACSPGWTPVYRLWNQRADSNHRYTTDRATRSAMLAQGYVAEGYGPDGVAMCSPGANGTFDLSLSTPELLLMPGDAREVYVVVAPMGGFTGEVVLSVTGLPAGVAGQLSATTLPVGPQTWAAKLRLTASGSAAVGAGSATILAQSGTRSATVPLDVRIAPPGDPVAVRLGAIADVEDRFRELDRQGLDTAGLLQGIATFMTAHPQYEEAGVDPASESAWGRQKDGTVHVVAGNRTPTTSEGARLPLRPTPRSDVETTVPSALLMQSRLDANDAMPQMQRYLSGKGWLVSPQFAVGVKALAGAKNVGFFYLDGHSGRGLRKGIPGGDSGLFLYGVQTSTLVTPSHELEFDLERTSGRLIFVQAPNGVRTTTIGPAGAYQESQIDTRYGITELFVREYMSFQPDSVVWINASRSNSSESASFVRAFHDKKAAVYLGWDSNIRGGESATYKAATYFVDRMVGANLHPVKEDPPQRPFPYDLVLTDMRNKGLDRAGLTLLAVSVKDGLAIRPIFAPSIRYVTVDEDKGLLTLTGEFGSNQSPKVTVGGTEVGVTQSSKSTIVANLFFDGPGSNGDVVVEVAGVKSNARQLSDWVIPITYKTLNFGNKKGIAIQGSGKVRFRADVGGYRLKPAEKPQYKLRGGLSHRDSRMDLTASGTWYSELDCEALKASGSVTLYSLSSPSAILGDLFMSYSRIDTEQLRGSLALVFANFNEYWGSMELQPVQNPKPLCSAPPQLTLPLPATFGLLDSTSQFPADQSDDLDFLPLPGIDFTFSKTFDIPAVSRSYSKQGQSQVITVSWPAVRPVSPPRDAPEAGK